MRAQFVLSEIGVGLRRNLTMTFAVIISVALSLALFGGAVLMGQQVDAMKNFWYDKVNVTIYLCNKNDAKAAETCSKGAVTAQQKEQIEADLKKLDIVETVHHETAEEAYRHYREEYGDNPIASVVTPDQMQESFRVKLKNPEKYEVVATAFSGRSGVHSVQDQRGLLETLFNMMRGMNVAALVVMGLMLVIALMLIVNTVRVSAFSRRRETGIMRLVGASSFYIQMPFIMEAAFAGLLGGLVACALLLVGRYFLIDAGLSLAEQMPLIQFIGWDAVFSVLPLVLVLGLLMPSLAAAVALRKYLKV
ncbi:MULTISPECIES: permease-like cell division protein FtsX [Streptomyces]|uniref:Cell division protein FtsX n=1 Tax=Streptomyces sudanensis TaxID=436397 RepID=A0ABY4TH06_9ACTN|nr:MULTISPECIES: permease-like cell division protein FtsX [Streptomyces]MCP9958800.1 permease-like cell division protein FtsX [Streptomyces sudanensis]MCP9987875.1 permease-like cell division protein FtsX [Streptomyces sudanensis]MCQ0000717.1 permease-like cell division protein FtsX [Streptomyces sudanensis]URN16300.1 permease-like cell division protein FtsX [Streptomyces sudanensis]